MGHNLKLIHDLVGHKSFKKIALFIVVVGLSLATVAGILFFFILSKLYVNLYPQIRNNATQLINNNKGAINNLPATIDIIADKQTQVVNTINNAKQLIPNISN